MQETRNKTKRRLWTLAEKEELVRLYPDMDTEEVAERLGKRVRPVYQMAKALGIKKSEAYLKVRRKMDAQRLMETGKSHRYPKGHVPHNKGRQMPDHVYEKAKATMFKKGQLPHNTNYDGHVRISKDGYQEIRIRQGKYRLLHLVNWEKVHGKLPKGHCLWNLDGDKLNTDPSNWELISRAENMRRNTIQRYPDEIKSVIRLKSKLIKKIKSYEKQD